MARGKRDLRSSLAKSPKSDIRDPSNGTTHCGNSKCSLDVEDDSIRCDTCLEWFHLKCSRLERVTFRFYMKNTKLTWICPNCIDIIVKYRGKDTGKSKKHGNTVWRTKTDVERTEKHKQDRSTDGETDGEATVVLEQITVIHNTDEGKELTEVVDARTSSQVEETMNEEKKDNKLIESNEDCSENLSMTSVTCILSDLQKDLKSQAETINALLQERLTVSKQLNKLQRDTEIATGRNRNVVIYGIPEPFIKEGRKREGEMRMHLVNILRMAGVPGHAGAKRVIRLGKWRGQSETPNRRPRPMLVEFTNPRHRDGLLGAAGRVSGITRGRIVIVPDNSTKTINHNKNIQTLDETLLPKMKPAVLQISRINEKNVHQTSALCGTRSYCEVAMGSKTTSFISSTPGDHQRSAPTRNQKKPLSQFGVNDSKNEGGLPTTRPGATRN